MSIPTLYSMQKWEMDMITCKLCDSPVYSRGLCSKHYYHEVKLEKIKNGKTCSVEGCNNPAKSFGLCGSHRAKQLKEGAPKREVKTSCQVEGCNNKHFSSGYCTKHYLRIRRNNTLETKGHTPEDINDKDLISIDNNNREGQMIVYDIDMVTLSQRSSIPVGNITKVLGTLQETGQIERFEVNNTTKICSIWVDSRIELAMFADLNKTII
jgi:hypothetical protein